MARTKLKLKSISTGTLPGAIKVASENINANAIDLTSKVTGTLPVANGGTALASGFKNGLTFYETMMLSSSVSGSGGDINGSFASTSAGNAGKLASSGMSASSGIFTFPLTGIFLLMCRMRMYADADIQYSSFSLKTSNDNFSSNDVEVAQSFASWGTHYSGNNYEMMAMDYIFDCANTTTHKFKMRYGSSGSISLGWSSSGANEVYVTVIRLGDT